MGDVIAFPQKAFKYKIEQSLSEMRSSLSDMYAALEKVDKGYKTIQKQAHDMEDNYQALMGLYIDEVGQDAVPLEWLDFCPYVGMERGSDGKITFTLLDPPEGGRE